MIGLRPSRLRCLAILACGAWLAACSDGDGGRAGGAADTTPWAPGVVFRSLDEPTAAGLLDRRGLIHMHSVYSHDACDDMPVVDGVRDPVCFDDFRRGMCQTRHDFIMLTDHPSDFSRTEYPDTLLYRRDLGDELVEDRGRPTASWAACPDGERTLILAGTESAEVMALGLEGHVAETVDARNAVYGSASDDAAATLRAHGAVVEVAHTEGWTPQQLRERDLDGFEMYNLHANFLLPQALGKAVELLVRVGRGDPGLAHPDLLLLFIVTEDPAYLSRWGSTLASGVRRVTTLATDAHRNTLPVLLEDGERVDSYRRLMLWFSNHLLVEPERDGSWDDRHLKEALRRGRAYGAFEVLGYPVGFDFHVTAGRRTLPLGSEVPLADRPVLAVRAPSVRNLAADREPPLLTVRILRAMEGGFEEVASSSGDLSFTPQRPGAYRAEVRMVPLHLREDMGADSAELLARDYVWVYSNPIYVRD
jgi:hypothetical protein